MSYSFVIAADTKDDARVKVEAELSKIVIAQPCHAADRQAAQDAAAAFIGILKEPSEGEIIEINMYGSLSWRDADSFNLASVSVSACIKAKA